MEFSDVSPHTPTAASARTEAVFTAEFARRQEQKRLCGKHLRFPVVDVVLTPDMEGVLEIDVREPGTYSINGGFRPQSHPVSKVVRIPTDLLEHWENAVHLDPDANLIKSFSVAVKAEPADSRAVLEFEGLRDDWSGAVKAYDIESGELIGETEVGSSTVGEAGSILAAAKTAGSGVSRQRLVDSLSWTAKYILGCRNTKEDSQTFGGLFLLYDLAARTQLRSDWPWSWGPAAKVLLDAATIPGVDTGRSGDELRRIAVDIAEATLRQRVTAPDNPARGLIVATIEPSPTYPNGFIQKASAADTLYLAGWGWMPFYRATGDTRFLEAAEAAFAMRRTADEPGQ